MTVMWLHAAASWWLVGVGTTVTLVHYPTFVYVTENRFAAFHRMHTARITAAVAIPWLLLGVTGLALVFVGAPVLQLVAFVSAIPVAVTVLFIVPCHRRLTDGFHAPTFRRLTRADQVRTVLFLAHAVGATAAALTYR